MIQDEVAEEEKHKQDMTTILRIMRIKLRLLRERERERKKKEERDSRKRVDFKLTPH